MILITPHMTSTKACEELIVMLDNTALERVKFTKFLGVLIDERTHDVTWFNPLFSNNVTTNIGKKFQASG